MCHRNEQGSRGRWPNRIECPAAVIQEQEGHTNMDGEFHVIILPNVKEHATLSARASVDHGVEVEITEEHVNRAADRGCCVSSCSASPIITFEMDYQSLAK
jgi:hypothetical protein